MLVEHPHLSSSSILEAFLTDQAQDTPFSLAKYIPSIDRQFSRAYLLDCSEVFQEEVAIGDF